MNQKRIDQLQIGIDTNKELSKEEIESSLNLKFTTETEEIKAGDVFIITVPTPIINDTKIPNLEPLKNASKTVGLAISKEFPKVNLLLYLKVLYFLALQRKSVFQLLKKIVL